MENITVTRFGGKFTPTKKEYTDLQTLIEMCDDLYPGIDKWYKKKVVSGLSEMTRTAYVIHEDNKPVGASIIKLEDSAKICSFRVLPDAEEKGYGKLLMALIARDIRKCGQTFHFTIPDYIWDTKNKFFKSYGMDCLAPTKGQYRLFDQELYGEGFTKQLWNKVIKTLPSIYKKININGIKLDFDLVMSIHPEFAKNILNGKKKVEIRRQFSTKWVGSKTLIYSTRPVNSFVGAFYISNVVADTPNEIWKNFSTEIGCSKNDFENYTNGKDKVYAIILNDSYEFKAPILRSNLSSLAKKDIRAPQSYARFIENSELEEAISIQTLLQSTL